MTIPKLRVARPTDDLSALKSFYVDGLGLKILYEFSDHDGFDGMMVGDPRSLYHFEFTKNSEHIAGRAPTKDNLIVLYLPDQREWNDAVERMQDAGFSAVEAFNPYWDRLGRTFEDPDGYRLVLQNAAWG
ncbi:VOC family protein [uncultured Tateyamaria sp.]|uniref:VOC family protein n=1 Tax=uncultured Tateyamaria sp. TaxID=455651 RepID=UPI00260E1D33|nr:VOC family protein [uncultured Tateyamaria sp.]